MARLEFFEAKKNGLLRGMDTHLSEEWLLTNTECVFNGDVQVKSSVDPH
jgi:hypothetical protein